MADLLDDQLLTTKETAEFLRKAVNTLEIDRMKGKGPPFIRIGKFVRYRRSELLAWIEEQNPGMALGNPDATR